VVFLFAGNLFINWSSKMEAVDLNRTLNYLERESARLTNHNPIKQELYNSAPRVFQLVLALATGTNDPKTGKPVNVDREILMLNYTAIIDMLAADRQDIDAYQLQLKSYQYDRAAYVLQHGDHKTLN